MSQHEILTDDEVSRIRHSYDPSGSMATDIFALSESHEVMRAERDLFRSIAERAVGGWEIEHPGEAHDTYHWERRVYVGESLVDVETAAMTDAQIDWVEERVLNR